MNPRDISIKIIRIIILIILNTINHEPLTININDEKDITIGAVTLGVSYSY